MTAVHRLQEREPGTLIHVHEFPRIQLFLNNHSQYIKISTLLSWVKGVAGETVNSFPEQMITEPWSPFVPGGGGINSPKVSVTGNCTAFVMSSSCIIHECQKSPKKWHFTVKMIKQPLYLSFLPCTGSSSILPGSACLLVPKRSDIRARIVGCFKLCAVGTEKI